MNRLLRTLLERAEHPRPVLTAQTTGRWPRATADRFEAMGVFAPLPPAEAVGCDSCGADHVEPVVWADAPNDGPLLQALFPTSINRPVNLLMTFASVRRLAWPA